MVFGHIKNFFFPPPPSPEDRAAAQSIVDDLIKSPVAVFSKSYCPYCMKAKHLLSKLGQDDKTKKIELDHHPQGSLIQQLLAERAGVSHVTVPQVFVGGKLIGGNDDLQALHKRGGLEPMLQ
ncbi:glutaredoxin 3 [Pseudohyphozyma bogoriensis]|nr:glutaredoxin 3 [Pseudohyphozyma bogoriensis]